MAYPKVEGTELEKLQIMVDFFTEAYYEGAQKIPDECYDRLRKKLSEALKQAGIEDDQVGVKARTQ